MRGRLRKGSLSFTVDIPIQTFTSQTLFPRVREGKKIREREGGEDHVGRGVVVVVVTVSIINNKSSKIGQTKVTSV